MGRLTKELALRTNKVKYSIFPPYKERVAN